MPYVQVWVEDCDGNCASGAKVDALEERIEAAVELLEEGRADEALELLRKPGARPQKMAAEYAAVKAGKSLFFHLYSQPAAGEALQ